MLKQLFFKNKIKFKQSQLTLSECAICLEKFQQNEEIIQLNCNAGHLFHQACIEHWSKNNLTCPLCRKEIKITEKQTGSLREVPQV
mmetsp:Transcript_8531/g.7882  ORF Transcript_8531/g.7882 Transcript_8531/m.7882 type:complete len:86 (-) Transcript_8531:402-659(-)